MSNIIDRLKLDHARLRSVLEQLDVAAEEAATGDTSADDRLFCMVDYLQEYPHAIHHPREDIVFASLVSKAPSDEQRALIEENAAQHRSLELRTADLLETVDSVPPDFAAIREHISQYRDLQLKHMEHEESQVFPIAAELLSEDDWQQLAAELDALHDPLFDAAESRFAILYQCLGVDPDDPLARIGAAATARFLEAT